MQEPIASSAVNAVEAANEVGLVPEDSPSPVASADRLSAAVSIQTPDFSALRNSGRPAEDTSIQRFYDVNVTVSAELGRVSMPIKDLLQLGQGSVVELNRPVTGPIDLVVNGVRIARGEVVVVDDCFAVHIKQIESQGKRAG